MKLHTMIEMYLKYDNMHTHEIINAFIFINNYLNLCIKCMLSKGSNILKTHKNAPIDEKCGI